jgi:hypothetical protein
MGSADRFAWVMEHIRRTGYGMGRVTGFGLIVRLAMREYSCDEWDSEMLIGGPGNYIMDGNIGVVGESRCSWGG